MILDSLRVDAATLRRMTGWEIKPEGACKGHVCVPLPSDGGEGLDVEMLSERLGMPLIADSESGLWAMGPESGGRVLGGAALPDLVLPDWRGWDFDFRSLRGQKIFLLAWASW